MPSENPGIFGIDHAIKRLEEHLTTLLTALRQEVTAGFNRLERIEVAMGTQLQDMDAKLQNIADTETKLGTDIQQVVDALKAIPNPPTDLTAQLGKLDAIAQQLIDTDTQTLSNLPPAPPPPPGPARRP